MKLLRKGNNLVAVERQLTVTPSELRLASVLNSAVLIVTPDGKGLFCPVGHWWNPLIRRESDQIEIRWRVP